MPQFRLPRIEYGPKFTAAADVGEIIDWGLEGSGIPDRWKNTQGEDFLVAILDTGTPRHADLPEPAFSHNFAPRSSDPFDHHGHATHCAGIVGARANEKGIVGVAPKCRIGYCKVLGDDGSGDGRGIASGIHKAIDEGAHVVSMSLGGGYDRATDEAILDAVQAGIFVFCAAGNEGDIDGVNTIGYPARLATTIAISSYNRDGQISRYSSRGPEVDFVFPGEDILSCWPNGTYRKLSGTSMSAPFAAGLAALMLSAHKQAGAGVITPIRNNNDLREHWKRHAQDMGDAGHDRHWGWGIVKAGDLLDVIPDAPTPTPDGPIIDSRYVQVYIPASPYDIGINIAPGLREKAVALLGELSQGAA